MAGQGQILAREPSWEFRFHEGQQRMNKFIYAWTKVQKAGRAVPWFIPGTEDMQVAANEAGFRDQLLVGLRLGL